MAEPAKLDGLEIVSIGTLYVGPWDKKYWSSSRGKDRYPYPVGYQAIRTHNGIVYKMEIHEGGKGPIFQINSTNKQSSCGQTPDLAWENFQKKGCSRIKLWNGKRFSCKIDGVEFFGFRNALVQRLLRELLSNVNGAPEQSMLPTNICSRPPAKEHDDLCSDACKYPDLMSYLTKPQVTGKRSRKLKGLITNAGCGVSSKRIQPQSWKANCEASNNKPMNQMLHIYGKHLKAASSSTKYLCKDVEIFSSKLVNLKSGNDVFLCNSNKVPAGAEKEPLQFQERSELATSPKHMSPTLVSADYPDIEGNVKLGDRTQLLDVKKGSPPVANSNRLGETMIPEEACNPPAMNDCGANNCSPICAPDTFASSQEDIFGRCTRWIKEEPCGVKQDYPSPGYMVLPKVSSSKTHQDKETETYKLLGSSEKSDFDSADEEEIAKSMITLLLPRAAPLLKYSSRKKKRKVIKDIPTQVQPENEFDVSHPPVHLASPGILKMESNKEVQKVMPSLNVSFGSTFSVLGKSVAPDSLEDDHHEDPAVSQLLLSSDLPVAVGAKSGKDDCTPDGKGSPVITEAVVYATSELPQTVQPEEHNKAPEEIHQNVVCSFDPALYHMTSVTKALDARLSDNCSNSEPDSRPLEIHLTEDLDTSHHCTKDAIQSNSMRLDADSQVTGLGKITEVGKDRLQDTVLNLGPAVAFPSGKYKGPLTEIITCRNTTEDCVPETHHTTSNLFASDSCQVGSSVDTDSKNASAEMRTRPEVELAYLYDETKYEAHDGTSPASHHQEPSPSCHERVPCITDKLALPVGISQAFVEKGVNVEVNLTVPEFSKLETKVYNTLVSCSEEVQVGANMRPDPEGSTRLLGCYSHSMPISSLVLARKLNEIYVCVICSLPEEQSRNLFLYKLPIQESGQGCPSFIGHTMIEVPVLYDTFGGEIAVDKSGVQFTPDAQGLVLLDDIEVAYCRRRKRRCQCSTCVSYCFEENAVKIVQVNTGYVTLVLKLKTIYRVHCILVCEPGHLVAVDESGRVYIWVMNPAWSGPAEEYVLSSYELIASRVVELRRIPKCDTVVVGHNGCGDFSLWDLTRRTVLSRFSAPAGPILAFHPLSLFNFQIRGLVDDKLDMKEHIKNLVKASSMKLWQQGQTRHSSSWEGDDIAVWLLICTASDTEGQLGYLPCNSKMNQAQCWRLGLLVKNMLIFGNVLDPRTTAIGVSAGLGIIGTQDGHVYLWDPPTGAIVHNLQNFEGGGISHIAAADSLPAVIAVAGEDSRLFVYLHHHQEIEQGENN